MSCVAAADVSAWNRRGGPHTAQLSGDSGGTVRCRTLVSPQYEWRWFNTPTYVCVCVGGHTEHYVRTHQSVERWRAPSDWRDTFLGPTPGEETTWRTAPAGQRPHTNTEPSAAGRRGNWPCIQSLWWISSSMIVDCQRTTAALQRATDWV